MTRSKTLVLLFLVLFTVPLLGWLTGTYVENTWETEFHSAVVQKSVLSEREYVSRGISYMTECAPGGTLYGGKVCSGAEEVNLVKLASAVTGLMGAGILALIFFAKSYAGLNRKRLAAVFGPMVRLVMVLLSIAVILQGGLFVYSVYTLETSLIQRVHGFLLLMIGVGAIYGAYVLLTNCFKLLEVKPSFLRAERLDRATNAGIYNLVGDIAQKLNATAPDNIIVGLEPNFFVTTNPVTLIGTQETLKGRTMYLSLGLMEIMTREELAAVIGHELGHFRGEDTEYSMKFSPIYTRLSSALGTLGKAKGSQAFALLPAIAVLSESLNSFAVAERTIGRERELLADKAGVEASSAGALASALVKVSMYSDYWNELTNHHVKILNEGRFFENLAETFKGSCKNISEDMNWEQAKSYFSQYVQPHPVDTHPPVAQRMHALGVPFETQPQEAAIPAAIPAAQLIYDVVSIEQRLTTLEIKWLEAIGAVRIPEATEQQLQR